MDEKEIKAADTDNKISVDGIASELGADLPEPSKNADKVAEHLAGSQAHDNATEGTPGKRGRKFKPIEEIHAELKAFNITFDKDAPRDKLMRELSNAKKRSGRSKGSKVSGLPASDEDQLREQKYKEMGAFCAGAFFQMASAIDAEEWKPNVTEEKSITESFQRVAEYYDWTDLHPVLGLTVALTAFAVPRMRQPKTSEKFTAFKRWFKKKIGK